MTIYPLQGLHTACLKSLLGQHNLGTHNLYEETRHPSSCWTNLRIFNTAFTLVFKTINGKKHCTMH